jgi:hypothetical protein
VIYETDEGKEDCLSGGRLDNRGLANAGGVKVDVGAFFCSLSSDIEIQDFDDVSNEVG